MSSLFKKPLDDINIEDINQLIDEGYPEGTYVEYKRELPSKKQEGDPWIRGASQISEYARNKLLTEVIAFANAQGGYLIIGVEESEEKPPKAVRIKPISRCADLAEKLRLQARDCIEPMLPLINAKEVLIDDGGAGIVVICVPQSRIAPHRLIQNSECYLRRNDRSEKMTMREIQDLTLQRSQWMHDLDRQFKDRHEMFQRLMNESFHSEDCHGIRVTLIPLSSDIGLDYVYKNHIIKPTPWIIPAKVGPRPIHLNTLKNFGVHRERPILRGVRYEGEASTHKTIEEIYCNGIIEYKFVVLYQGNSLSNDRVYPNWVLSFAINAMITAHIFRQEAGFPDVEYGMEVEIARIKGKPILGEMLQGQNTFEIESNPLIFPRLSVGSLDEFPTIMKVLFRDMWDSAGVDLGLGFDIQIPEDLLDFRKLTL